MRLVRFTFSNAKSWEETFAVNPEYVVRVVPTDKGYTEIHTMDGKISYVMEGYDTVCNLLMGSL